MHEFFADPSADDVAPIHAWIQGEGSMVYCRYGEYWSELRKSKKCTRKFEEFSRTGRARLIGPEEIRAEEEQLQTLDIKSNDLHILALARASRARLLYTKDKNLIDDFKTKAIIDGPRGSVYSSAKNRHILTKDACKKSS